MLPAQSRIRRSTEFTHVVRQGRSVRRGSCLVYALPTRSDEPSRAGFIVSKAVGNAVVRHRVVRRLRHLAKSILEEFTPGFLVVVRAMPSAGQVSFAQLGADLAAALRACLRKKALR